MISINIFGIFCCIVPLIADTSAQNKNLEPSEIALIAKADNYTHFTAALSQIIQPRVVGTPSHEDVKNYIINELGALNFNVELDLFAEQVPVLGNITFTNIIGRLNPSATKYLALACHYDSKLFPGQVFYGAIDSAVPCSMMLNLVKTLQDTLDKNREDVSLMLIFFDGEEAIMEWSAIDSLYGSRHLASKWESTRSIAMNSRLVDQIEAFILLDLLGAANPQFRSFYENTEGLHFRLTEIEHYLQDKKLISNRRAMFIPQVNFGGVDDDHRPFLEKDVPILHMVPLPFPKVWHKTTDNLENLHMPTIRNLMRIMRVFIADYFTTHEPTTTFRV